MKQILQIISDTNIGGGGRSLLNYLHYQDLSEFSSTVVLPRNSALKPAIDALHVPCVEIDAMADQSLDWHAVPILRRLCRELSPDLVHTHGSLSGRMAAKLAGKPAIYTKHCAFPPGRLLGSPPGRLANRLLDACLSDGVIAVGPSSKEILLQSGIPEKKLYVLFNGVEALSPPSAAECQALRQSWGFSPDDFVVGILSRLEAYKGHSLLLEAAQTLLPQYPKLKLLFAGAGSQEEALRRQAEALPPGTVVFTGFVSQVEQALGVMDVQVNASTLSETSSLSLLEGFSLGLPAVVSSVGGNPFLVDEGENGLIFENKNAAALADCLRRLMDDPALLPRMRRRAREIYEERFTGESFARNVESVYRRVLQK